MGNKHNFQDIRSQRIQRRDAQLLKFLPHFAEIIKQSKLSPQQIEAITRTDISGLVALLNSGQATSLQLVAIFGTRAATIGKELCIITEDYFEYALKRAAQCDDIRHKTGMKNWVIGDEWSPEKYFPPLFGIPTSIKDNIQMEGTSATVGLTIRANKIDNEDCFLIKAIKKSGMIPFIKTNLPQLAMNFDSNNFLWGRSLNPWNQKKSVGGSSGGQGAAIAARISPIGVGNDIGGSLRIPAAFCGITSLLSGQGRLPMMGTYTKYSDGVSGMDLIKVVSGPMSNSIDGLALWMKTMTDPHFYQKDFDPYIKLHSFDTKIYQEVSNSTKKYKIGFFDSLQLIECTPGSRRALMEVVEFLKKQGHQVTQFTFPNQRQTIFTFFQQIAGEGGLQSYMEMLDGQKLVDQYSNFSLVTGLNSCFFGCLKFITGLKHPRMQMLIEASKNLSTHQYLVNSGKGHGLKREWIKFWRQQKFDFVLCPGFGSQAPSHGMSNDATLLAAYTFIWNVLGMAASCLPITVVKEDEQNYESHWQDEITTAITNFVKDSAGLPVSIQLVGLPFEEEKILGFSKRIEAHFQFAKNHPQPNL